MKRLLCLLLLLFQLPLYAGQDRYEIETAYFHDGQHKHTLASAQEQAYKPYRGQLRLGFTEGETWIRIRLKAPQASASADTPSSLTFMVEPYSLDRLSFYQEDSGNWSQQLAGEMQPQKKKVCIELHHCFEFSTSNTGDQFAYLKVETTAVRIVRTELMTADDALQSSIAAIKSVNSALNLSIALLILSVIFFFFERSRLLFVFCGFQTAVVLSICAFAGVFPHGWAFMSAVQPNTVAGFALVIRMAMTVLMAWIVVSAYRPSTTYGKWVVAVLLICGFNLLLVLTGYETEAGLFNYIVGCISPFIQIWGARTVTEHMPGRWIFTTGWLIFFDHRCFGISLQFGHSGLA